MQSLNFFVYLNKRQEQSHGLRQDVFPLLADRVKERLRGRDGRHEVLEDVELDSNVLEGVSLPKLGVRCSVRHDREENILKIIKMKI